jgi:hypothetical protein
MGLFDVLSVRRSPAGFAPVIVIGQGLVCYGREDLTPVLHRLVEPTMGWRPTWSREPSQALDAKAVANTRYLIKSKLGVSSDIELVRLALRQRNLDVAEIALQSTLLGDINTPRHETLKLLVVPSPRLPDRRRAIGILLMNLLAFVARHPAEIA